MEAQTPASVARPVARVRSPGSRPPVVVGVDGAPGVGKTVLALALRDALGDPGVPEVHLDRYRLPTASAAAEDASDLDVERLLEEVLRPLRRGRAVKLPSGSRRRTRHRNPPVVILEGLFAHEPRLRADLDVAVWVDADEDERQERLRARAYPDTEWLAAWEDRFRTHERATSARATADFVVTTTTPASP